MNAAKLATDTLKERAEELFRARKHQRSLQLYAELIDRDPQDARLRVRSGELAIRLGRPADAARSYLRAAELFGAQGKTARAAAALTIARSLAPELTPRSLPRPIAIAPLSPVPRRPDAIELPYVPIEAKPEVLSRRNAVVSEELCPEEEFDTLYR